MDWKAAMTRMLTSSAGCNGATGAETKIRAGDTGSGRRRGRGFTLVELIIVLIIMGIALGIVGPLVMGSLDKYRLHQSTRSLASYFRKTREVALKEGIRAYVYYNPEDGAFQTVFRRHDERVPLTFPEWFELADGVEAEMEVDDRFDLITGDLPHFVFYPMGNASGGTVTLSVDGEAHSVITVDDLTGNIEVLDRKEVP
jgi:general secretion pathway protein H